MKYDPLLEEQLARLGVHPEDLPTTEQYWQLLDLVSETYAERSGSEPVSDETLAALDEVMDRLAQISRSVPPNPEAIDAARRQWVSRLQDVVAVGRAAGADGVVRMATSLGRSLDALFESLVQALSAEAAGGALQRELSAAARVVLPDRDWLETGALSLAAASQPASTCSGDFWLAHRLDEQRTLMVVGDVTGHGAASMVLAAGARAACALVVARPNASLRDFVEALHRVVRELGRGERMMTCAVVIHDATRRELAVANAGHRLPLLVRADPGADVETGPILARGAPLGAGSSIDVDMMKVPVSPGDLLVLYTDGVIDTEDEAGEPFTERRLRALLAEHHEADPRITRDGLLAELATFRGRRPRTDDTTFVLARMTRDQAPDPGVGE